MSDPDIAILHDQFRTMGGAERVAVTIARTFDAPIYVKRVVDGVAPADVTLHDTGNVLTRHGRRLTPLIEDVGHMLGWQHAPELHDYDVLIQTKTNPYWYVPKDDQILIRYLHSTPRGMYDRHYLQSGSPVGDTLKILQRMLYRQTVPYADRWLANSDLVQRRLELYWDQPSSVVYPPVDTDAANPARRETGDYYLHVGRLAANKRIPLLRDVAERVDVPVVVAGDGPERDALDPMPENLDYRGYVSEAEKWDLYAGAKATLMLAENEDFGLVPIESYASGTPVIGVEEGFTQYQIANYKTGLLVPEPDAPTVVGAIKAFEDMDVKLSSEDLAVMAAQFGADRFQLEMHRQVSDAIDRAQITPSFDVPEASNE